MKKRLSLLFISLFLFSACALNANAETVITLGEAILVNGEAISADPSSSVYLALQAQTHADVPEALRTLQNRVIVIAAAGDYRFSGEARDTQIAVRAGATDKVRVILDSVTLSCRTAPAIIGESALDPRTPGEYGLSLVLASGSENSVSGAHTKVDDGDKITPEYDGAISSAVSLGVEGSGSLTVDADNEGIEVSGGHLTINGGTLYIAACDDPLNVSEDGVGVLTINGGYVYSAVKPLEGGEGDGVDSNGSIVINGGTVINLAHPASMDSGIDADLGSAIHGGTVVGAGNMYDPIEPDSAQLFMMLEFAEKTDQLIVVTDENDQPIFAYDFPHSYTYIAFSSPALKEGTYRVYLGGEIEGEQTDGLYTSITAYTPGTRMQHGGAETAQRGTPMTPPEGMGFPPKEMPKPPKDGHPEPPEGLAFPRGSFGNGHNPPSGRGGGRGPRGLASSSATATGDFALSKSSTGFTSVTAAK